MTNHTDTFSQWAVHSHSRGSVFARPFISGIATSPTRLTETHSYLTESPDGPRASQVYWPKLCQTFFTSISVCICVSEAAGRKQSSVQCRLIGGGMTHKQVVCVLVACLCMIKVGEGDSLWKTEVSVLCCCFSVIGTLFSVLLNAPLLCLLTSWIDE